MTPIRTPAPLSLAATSSIVDADWPTLREHILTSLHEDPVNEARVVHDLDRRAAGGLDAAQRVLAALTGTALGPADARRLLEDAVQLQAELGVVRGRPVPLRLALLDILLRENRRRRVPLLAEIRLSPAPSTEIVADATHTPTSPPTLVGALQSELRRARRFDHPTALLRLRLDAWEELTWCAGSVVAERYLGETAILMKNDLRDVDWVARTLDADLLAVLSGTGRLGALLVARRLVEKLKAMQLPLPGGPTPASVSIGIAAFPADARFAPELLASARSALLRARAEGGGVVSDQGRPSPRSLLRVPGERIRIMIRRRSDRADGEESPTREGLLFPSPVPYEVGAHIELECIEVAGVGHARLAGRVVRLEALADGGFEVGVACRLDEVETTLLRGEASG